MTGSTIVEDDLLVLFFSNILSPFYGEGLFVFQQDGSQVGSDDAGPNLMH
jgi:hypothetical protein